MANNTTKKQIFLLFSNDQSASADAQKLIMVTTSQNKLRSTIVRLIIKGEMNYGSSNSSVSAQVKKFREDWKNCSRAVINSRLEYGSYDFVYDGEII